MHTVLLLGLAVGLGAPAAKDAPKDKGSIVGDWVGVTAVTGGKDRPAPEGGVTFSFAADGKLSIKEGGRDRPAARTYKVDPKKDPAEIDILPLEGKDAPAALGIYKIDGDTLTLCIGGAAPSERPTKFASPEGS